MRINNLISGHLANRPHMQLQDIYKLLYQSYMGIGHLISDTNGAIEYLREEMAELDHQMHPEPLWETISTTGLVGRVNLRPLQQHNIAVQVLAERLVLFAQNPPGSKHELLSAWNWVGTGIDQGELPFTLPDYHTFTETLEKNNYPMMHHSLVYQKLYQPAYRILSINLFRDLVGATCL